LIGLPAGAGAGWLAIGGPGDQTSAVPRIEDDACRGEESTSFPSSREASLVLSMKRSLGGRIKMVAHVTTQEFTDKVLDSKRPVLFDFYAAWCNPCRLQSPILDSLAAEGTGAFEIVKVDVEQDSDLAVRYGVSALPTLLVFHEGEPVERFVGLQSREVLHRTLTQRAPART
jgi:thioredoxin